jgi:hypothetical protein
MTQLTNTKQQRRACPGCRSEDLIGEFNVASTPVVLNYRFATAVESQAVARGQVLLRQCRHCGLVFNSTFDPSATPYDERYENTQCCSNAFQAHLDSVADSLASRYDLCKKQILEVGCGKGDFLKLICKKTKAIGHGYDTSCEQNGWTDDKTVCFHQRYLATGEITSPAALIICRHVVEHVHEIGQFFRLLHAISVEANNAPVYIETPDWDWIVNNEAHWDIFYEHCNYFSMAALAKLATGTGFEVIGHTSVFGGQYQAIEIQPSNAHAKVTKAVVANLPEVARSLVLAKEALGVRIRNSYQNKKWAIWGAGAKGVSLANTMQTFPPRFLIDANPAKQGGYIAGTHLEILSPEDSRLFELDAVLVANPNYLQEIAGFAFENGLSFSLASL